MLSVRFYLHPKANAEGYCPLNIIVHADGHFRPPLRMAVGEKVKPQFWNHAKQVVLAKGKHSLEINARLERIEAKVAGRFRELLDAGVVPTKADLAQLVNPAKAAKALKPTEPVTPREVNAAWGQWYLQEKNVGNKSGTKRGESYVRRGNQTVGHLEKFDPTIKVRDLITRTGEYRLWLLEHAGIQDATIKKHIDLIRTWLKFLGLPFNRVATLKEPKSVKTALSWKEVQQLYAHEYTDPNHRRAVDAFAANCQACLRFEDLLKPSRESLVPLHAGRFGEALCVNLNQGKTGDHHFVPLPPLAKGILEGHGWRFPVEGLEAKNKRGITVKGQKAVATALTAYNLLLKEAAQLAGLNRPVRRVKVHNGHVSEEYRPLHEIISSHMARHTGYTLVKVATKSRELAEAQIGHAGDSPYLHTSPEVLAEELLAAWEKIAV